MAAPPVSLYLYLVGFLVLAGEVIALSRNSDEADLAMEEEELLGLFEALDALLEDPDWAQMHPGPCTDTLWPGVQCEIGDEDPPMFHITSIHVGPDIVTPPCKSSASLSSSLQKLPYLKTLSIFNCFVKSPIILSPALFGAFSSLEHLTLNSNPTLSGSIPLGIAKVTSLRVLSLSQNNLQGSIPSELGGLINLEQLDLSHNNLSGEIPREIGNVKALTILDLSWNSLEGKLPWSLGQLHLLQKIDLGSNKVLGKIPSDLGNLKRLVLLDLSHNFITGPVPEAFSGLEQLQYLILDHNSLNSDIPLFLRALNWLTSISLSRCGLIGSIPISFSSLKNLTSLSLDNNSLTGSIPSSLGSLPNLDHLNVSHNQLTGELHFPEEFIQRLGRRLDARGNSGLCASNKTYGSISISLYLETIGDNKTCPEEKGNKELCPESNPDDSKGEGIASSSHRGRISSSAPPCLHQKACTMHFRFLFSAFLFGMLWDSFASKTKVNKKST